MINLDTLQMEFNATLIAYPTIGVMKKSGKITVDFSVCFLQDSPRERRIAWNKLLGNLDNKLQFEGVTFSGEFNVENVKDGSHPYDILHITGEAIAYTREIILDLSGTTEIVNLGYMETPVTITTQGSCTITGLSEKPIKTLSGVTITDDGLILDTNGNNASNSVEMWEFPKLALGKSTVKVTSPVTMTYKVRLI